MHAAGHHPQIGLVATGYTLAVPVAVVFVMLYVLHRPLGADGGVPGRVLISGAVLTLLLPLAAEGLGVAGTVVGLAVIGAVSVALTLASLTGVTRYPTRRTRRARG